VTRFGIWREVAIGLGVYGTYLLVRRRVLASDGRGRGLRAAARLAEFEDRLGIGCEEAVQRAALRAPRVLRGLNAGYAVFNVGLTVGWLALLYARRDPAYGRLRRACALAHLGAQPFFLLHPVSPPRTLPRYVDTLAELSGLNLEHPALVRFYNPVAAMPSLHVAFAVVTSSAAAERASGWPTRYAAYAYPPLVAGVVTATGNHFVLDSLAGAALGAVAWRTA
jgi:PAP2 superfamily